jgi:hypothetical protein
MCQATAAAARAAGRAPRWGRLYASTAALVAVLGTGELLVPAGPWRAVARAAACAATLAVMALWVRGNRAALDQRGWCDCAASRIRVRVIASSPRAAAGAGDARPVPEREAMLTGVQ